MNYRKIFENNIDPMLFFDENGKIIKTNKSLEDLIGYNKTDLKNKDISELLDEHSKIELKDLERNPNQRRELKIITGKGNEKIIDVKINKFGSDIYFGILRDITKHKELAEKDPLTEIYNYRKFYDKLEEEMERSERYGHDLSVLLIDVDNFKKYNDSKGHVAGDQLLKKIGKLLQKESRFTDTVCRYGGDEFAIILPETDRKGARELLERIKESYGELEDEITGLSIGIAEFQNETDPKEIVKKADKEMYREKKDRRS